MNPVGVSALGSVDSFYPASSLSISGDRRALFASGSSLLSSSSLSSLWRREQEKVLLVMSSFSSSSSLVLRSMENGERELDRSIGGEAAFLFEDADDDDADNAVVISAPLSTPLPALSSGDLLQSK